MRGSKSVRSKPHPVASAVTERKPVGKALPYSEQYFRPLIERALDVVVVLNSDGTIRYGSPSIQNVIGYTPEERQGKSFFDLIHPDDMASATSAFTQLLQNQVASVHIELRIRHKDGSWRSIEAVGQNLLNDPAVAGIVVNFRDITDHKQAEEALRESEASYRELADSIADVFFAMDRDLRYTYWNKASEELTGIQAEDAIGKSLYDLFPDISGSKIEEIYMEALRKRQPQSIEHVYQIEDKNIFFEISAYPTKDGLSVFAKNVTERKRAEEALRESEEKYRTILEDIEDGYYEVDIAGNLTFFNDAMCEIIGYSKDEMMGMNNRQYMDKENAKKVYQAFNRVYTTGKHTREFGWEIIRKDGTKRFIEAPVSLKRNSEGEPIGFCGIVRDVTEHKMAEEALRDSEERYRLLAENVRDVITSTDMNLKPTYISPSYTRLLGYSVEEAMARTIEESLTPASREVAVKSLAQQLSPEHDGGGKRSSFPRAELEFYHKDGSTVWVEVSVAFLRNSNGEPAGLVNLLRDITERKQAEEEVRRLNEELEQRVIERTTQLQAVNKELEAFAYSVSHDLRAPLRSIDGFSQVLLEDYAGKLDKEGKDYLQRVRSASQRMAELIDDILSLSRVTRSEMRRETVDLSALAQTTAVELQQSQPERQVEFIITPGLVAKGDANLLRAALENLLGNAWKFTNKRSPVRIEFGCAETSGQSAYFVRDNGIGFDMAYADKLFGAFQRLHSSNEYEGTGIGLATVQRIIHRHGGNIWAESAVDQGATFYFTLQPERDGK